MPPKTTPKSKKASAWMLCEKCQVFLTSKDIQEHVGNCPPFENWSHSFVQNKTLHSYLQVTDDITVEGLSSKQLDKFVFLTQSTIQLCGLTLGGYALIESMDKDIAPVVQSVWMAAEKPATTVLFTQNVIQCVWMTAEKPATTVLFTQNALNVFCKNITHNKVMVSRLKSPAIPAQEVFIESIGMTIDEDSLEDLVIAIHRSNIDVIYNIRNKVYIDFFGKIFKFTINRFVPYDHSSDEGEGVRKLEEDLNKMELSDTNVRSKTIDYYKIIERTKWTLVSDKKEEGYLEVLDPFSTIGGVDHIISEMRDIINLALESTPPIAGLKLSRGILLYGTTGSGKTSIARALCLESGANFITINGPEVYSKFFGETEAKLKEIFAEAVIKAPSVVLLDEIDTLCPKRGNSNTDQEKRVASTLLTLLDSLHTSLSRVVVIACTTKPDLLDPALRRCGRIDCEIEIPIPNPLDRAAILSKLLAKSPRSLSDESITRVANAAHGFVGADLSSLCSQAAMHAYKRSVTCPGEPDVTILDLEWALTQVKPSAMREVMIEIPNVKWNDIGGQNDLKLKLKQAIEWPLKHPESFLRLGITPPRGVLMFGPPGCSKTMIAKALATESKLNFLSIKGPELFSKWVGESERAVRDVFRKARQVAPSIIFFDEIDALGGERGSQSSGSNVQERVLAQMLTELDGVSPLGNVTVVAATNRPDRIDRALLRPGRLDRIVYVPLPDADTRADIFRIKLSTMPVASGVSVEKLVVATDGYSGAEVQAVCHEAALKALEESLDALEVRNEHFEKALLLVTPRTPESLIKLYESYLTET